MSNDQIIFEHPLNEKCRTLLRLSHLFETLDFHLEKSGEWHSRASMTALLDISTILARADIKSDLLKELERYRSIFSSIANKSGVDHQRLQVVLDDIQSASNALQDVKGQLGHAIRANEFLKSIQKRASIPGSDFDFDLPQYHYWLGLTHDEQLADFDEWRDSIAPVENAVSLSLGIIRHSVSPTREHANSGFYQNTIDTQGVPQMVRVEIPRDIGLFAEISGGKHRFSIRFLEADDMEHPTQTKRDVSFTLTACVI